MSSDYPGIVRGGIFGNIERIEQPLYDVKLVKPGQQDVEFFTTPVGHTDLEYDRLLPKGWEDTNLYYSGSLPHGQAFVVHGLALDVGRGGTVLLHSGFAQFEVMSKIYLTVAPLHLLARYRAWVNTLNDQDYRQNNYAPYRFGNENALKLQPQTPFRVRLQWKRPPEIKRPVALRMSLVGNMFRPVY